MGKGLVYSKKENGFEIDEAGWSEGVPYEDYDKWEIDRLSNEKNAWVKKDPKALYMADKDQMEADIKPFIEKIADCDFFKSRTRENPVIEEMFYTLERAEPDKIEGKSSNFWQIFFDRFPEGGRNEDCLYFQAMKTVDCEKKCIYRTLSIEVLVSNEDTDNVKVTYEGTDEYYWRMEVTAGHSMEDEETVDFDSNSAFYTWGRQEETFTMDTSRFLEGFKKSREEAQKKFPKEKNKGEER